MTQLKLGPLPDKSTVRMTITIPTTLKAQLDRYAALHSKNFGAEVDATTLVPLMLAMFLTRDKAFQRSLRLQS